jgi:tetratricopeptide (TPR) repeat protein
MASGLDEMRRTLREVEPRLPSTMVTSLRKTELTLTAVQHHAEPPKLISELKGDLDWIVMKALEKDRDRRYETANGLAMDIQRYLDSEPVVARPPSQLYRLQKLVRRNKIIFAAGSAVALTLLIGLGMSTWLFIRERDAREHEAQLRAQAEDRAKITQAVMCVSQGKFDDADEMLKQLKSVPSNPTLDAVSAFRSVGEWMALQGRWQQAAERYSALINIDKLDNISQIANDYEACGVVLAESTDHEAYEHFWQMAVTNYSATPNESVLIIYLEFPLSRPKIEEVKPIADYIEKRSASQARGRVSEWALMPVSLWKYRSGDYESAVEWSQRGGGQKNRFPACDADLHLIAAMAYYQHGQVDEACSELAQGQQMVETKLRGGLTHGKADAGYWFDWVFANHLLQEAKTLIDCNSDTQME